MASISDSVEKELVRIGATLTKTLCQGVSDRADDLERYRITKRHQGLSEGERLAIREEATLKISWAVTPNNNASLVKKALLQAYVDRHGQRPGYVSKMTGIRYLGNREPIGGESVTAVDLDWSPWYPAVDKIKALPQGDEHGVFRIKDV